jgi:hypothetical protein
MAQLTANGSLPIGPEAEHSPPANMQQYLPGGGQGDTTARPLGRLERQDLRAVWASEAANFTPWLAQPQNLVLLGEALDLTLELEAQEKPVGPFRADILCRDLDTGYWVLIENQLERTDHVHLGQILTYASGLDAVTIVWVASRFTEEHRAALDWLNKITDDSVRFFGLEVELWRIGDSPAAPKFNVIAKPNGWSHAVARAARAIEDTDLSDVRSLQRDYWAALNAALDKAGGPVSGSRKPQPQSWMRFPIGRHGFHLTATMLRGDNRLRVNLLVYGPSAKTNFQKLIAQRPAIEQELGYPLEWEELPSQQDSRVSVYLDNVNPEDQIDWPRQHQWLAKRLDDMRRVFASRVCTLDSRG